MNKFIISGLIANQLQTTEAREAKQVLGEDWEIIHAAIQSGDVQVPETAIELLHASNILAATNKGDKEAMLEALVLMNREVKEYKDLVNENEKSKVLVLAEKAMIIIERDEPLVKRGRAFVDSNKKSAWYTDPLIKMCQKIRFRNPSFGATEIFYNLGSVECEFPIQEIQRADDEIDILKIASTQTKLVSLKSFGSFMSKHRDEIGKKIRISE